MITLANVSDFVSVLIKEDVVFEEMKTDHPEILADLVTFKSNPNCSCRAKVFKYFQDKFNTNSEVLNKYIKNPEAVKSEVDKIYLARMQNTYSGKIVNIPKDEESWKKLSAEAGTKAFRSFSVVDNGDTLTVYFI